MSIVYAIRQKGRIVLLLSALAFLVIANCTTYNRNIAEMGDSVSEVYADRLLAQDYIYKLSARIHERRLALEESAHYGKQPATLPGTHSLSILALLRDYEATKFTPEEKIVYDEFRSNIFRMIALQQRYGLTLHAAGKTALLKAYHESLDLSLTQLEELSGIQMQRGRNINANTQKIVSFTSLLHQLDWALILIIVVMIMAIIFATKSSFPRQFQNHLLN